ncbi:MAG: prolipoprotein diacylglyceryl transferase [Chloroflexota bacterium]
MPLVAPSAVIPLAFDPTLRLGDIAIRLQTIGIAFAVFAALVLAARIARRTPVHVADPDAIFPADERETRRLHRDDLLYVVLGLVPGAIIGGRIGYVLIHFDYYRANAGAIVDPAQGGLQLSVAVLGAVVTGAVVANLLEAPPGRWLHVAALPLLIAIAIGKVALALGGEGQGTPAAADWATAYLGPGPWGSLAPIVPSNPSQLYEAAGTAVVLIAMTALVAAGTFQARDGRTFWIALAMWAVVRFVVAFTWRDQHVLGPLVADQLLTIAIFGLSIAGAQWLTGRGGGRVEVVEEPATVDPAWPDPATRPRF